MEVEAAMELQRHLDETGVHQVRIIYVVMYFEFAPGLLVENKFTKCKLFDFIIYTKFTWFAPNLYRIYTKFMSQQVFF